MGTLLLKLQITKIMHVYDMYRSTLYLHLSGELSSSKDKSRGIGGPEYKGPEGYRMGLVL